MQFLGLHLEKKILTLALVQVEKKQFQLKKLQVVSLDNLQEVQLLLASLLGDTTWIISTLETKQVLLRSLEMTFKTRRAFLKVLPFQLDQLIPYPLEEGIVIPLFEKRSFIQRSIPSTVTLLSLHEKTYKEHLLFYQNYHIDPDWIGYGPQGLCRFVCHYTKETTAAILHMGQEATYLVVMLEGGLLHALQIDLGKEHFMKALQLDQNFLTKVEVDQFFEKNTQENISQELFPSLFDLIKKFSCELDRCFYFLMQKPLLEGLNKVVLLKEFNFLKQFIKVLEKTVGSSIDVVENEGLQALMPYALPIGLAIDAFSKDGKKVQFKKPHEITSHVKKHLIKKMGKYGLACLICSILAFFSSQLILKVKESSLHKQISYLLENYAEELPITSKNKQEESVVVRLKQAEKYLSKIKKPYGYYLTPTSVTSFLEKLTQDRRFKEGLQLEELEYTLDSYPNLEHPEAPYKICVRCVVSSLKQNLAEMFFEELEQDKLLVEEEPRMDITKQDLRYEALFYLKAN